jgi:hypothetical protein
VEENYSTELSRMCAKLLSRSTMNFDALVKYFITFLYDLFPDEVNAYHSDKANADHF